MLFRSGGYRLVLLPRFDAATVLRLFQSERVNCWVGVPTMYWALLQLARQQQLDASAVASLRLCVSGGAPMPVQLMRDFEAAFGVRILEGYGLSETSPVACFNQVYKPSKPGTVGPPLPACEVRVVDDQDRVLSQGQAGEVVIRGHNVMKGYYRRPVETAEALKGGWFHTGDIGVFDADGYLAIVDRKKDMVLRGGENVYCAEVEAALYEHPGVHEAAVFGILSLIAWSLALVVTLKYVLVIMRADNRGEGGLLALTALALRTAETSPRRQFWILGAGLVGDRKSTRLNSSHMSESRMPSSA